MKRKRCEFCHRLFLPDRRVGQRQRACSETGCKKARARQSSARWKKANPASRAGDYGLYVKAARVRDPTVQRRYRARLRALRIEAAKPIVTTVAGSCCDHFSCPISPGAEIGHAILTLIPMLERVAAFADRTRDIGTAPCAATG